jgi:phi13 family phage major tail protein
MANSVFGELIGLDSLHYAQVTADTTLTYSTGAVSYLAPGGDISHEAKADLNIRYYDNVPMFSTVQEGATAVAITVSGVSAKLAGILTGKPYDATHGILVDTGNAANTPDCAMSGRMDLGDGGYRYFQYLKGKFALGAMKAASKTDKIKENTYSLTYTALVTIYQFTMPDTTTHGVKAMTADTTDAAFTAALQAAWFSSTQTPASLGAVSAIALSTCVPAANATAQVITIAPVLTFNNAIASDNVILMKGADNSVVAVTKSWDMANKILTITPTSSLTSAAIYYIVIDGVKDIYGQTLNPSVSKFTCA